MIITVKETGSYISLVAETATPVSRHIYTVVDVLLIELEPVKCLDIYGKN